MKKIYIILVCLVIAGIFCSCNKYQKNNVILENQGDISNEKDGCNESAPYHVNFSSIDDIKTFINAVRSSNDEYNEYKEKNFPAKLLPKSVAEKIANCIEDTVFPIPKEEDKSYVFSMDCFASNEEYISVFYEIDGIRYRFHPSSVIDDSISFGGKEFIDSFVIGNDVVNMYKGDNSLEGSLIHTNGQISVLVFPKDIEELPDIAFEFTAIE